MKKIIAIFSVLAMFSVSAISIPAFAQDPPKNTVKKPATAKGGKMTKKGIKAKKANVAPATISK